MEEEPATKRQKMFHLDDRESLSKYDDILHKIQVSNENLMAVLNDELISECQKVDVYIGRIVNKTDISYIVKSLNEKFPVPELRHIKRVKDSEIVITSIDACQDVKMKLEKEKLLSYFDLNKDFQIISVVAKEPIMRWQYDIAKKTWPCNFHPNKDLEKMYRKEYFSLEEVVRHRKYMAVAYDVGIIVENVSKEGNITVTDQIDEKTRHTETLKGLEKVRGVVVVDPNTDSIVSVGYDFRSVHPCQHPVMVAIDNVAKTQNGGSWCTPEVLTQNETFEDDSLDHRGVPPIIRKRIQEKYPGFKFGATPFKSKDSVDLNIEGEVSGPYLCTNYYVYATNEPCVMCSMALVHARAKRVFFGLVNSSNGGLVSKCKLHTLPGLNHRYEVYTGFFQTEHLCNAQCCM
ncbi:putative inactive tRNA-specific adenosine deaminase-like protein 3 [Arctopsyche grandis]|uniref:putative inactive tRNA-specific adenosine deaminase-like protein 3 n=1 Tax=Arctopsyche grandis TaxID=121162 RepID=UPI00406D8407